jgi:signal transduction histidine kinase
MADLAAARLPLTQRVRPWQWVAFDVFVALLFVSEVRRQQQSYENHWLDVIILGLTVVFPFRRRFPLPALVLLAAGTTTLTFFPKPYSDYQPFAMMLALYSLTAQCSRRVAIAASGGLMLLAIVIMSYMVHSSPAVALLSGCAVGLMPGIAGYSVQQRRVYAASLAGEQARLVEAEVTSRLAEERIRIARELHDVVAHAVSLMTVQAGVAVFREHEAAEMRRMLGSIEETGRAALVDMRQLLGVLRSEPGVDAGGETRSPLPSSAGGTVGERSPVPTLDDLGTLVAQTAQAGLRVSLRVDGEPRPLPAGVELAAYRIVQESLTNVLRHARTSVGAVVVGYGAEDFTVSVSNPAPPDGLPPKPPGPAGHGLVGMAERAALFGGSFTAGPAEEGGYAAFARFPLAAAAAGTAA